VPGRATWPKQPIPLTLEQERAREGFMKRWHEELPTKYSAIESFNHGSVAKLPVKAGSRTLEIGAGLGAHAAFEDLSKQDYYCMEYREEFCKTLRTKFPDDHVLCGDIQQRLPWADAFFDRIVVIHVLEHLRNLPLALAEIHRLLKPDGWFDVVLPCEGGLAYSMARKVSAERLFRREFKMDYTPIIRNEHVSTLSEIEIELDDWFERQGGSYFPLKVPVPTLNLVVAYRLRPRRR
jgi:SAM-dependent methyltransferase